MAMPFVKDVHIDKALSNLAIEYKNEEFVAEKILPTLEVAKESDKYFIFGREDFKRYFTVASPTGELRQFEYSIQKSQPYSLTKRGLVGFVPDDVIKNADDPLKPLEDETDKLMRTIMLDYEAEVATYLTTTSNYPSGHYESLSGGDKWSDYTNSNPIKKVDDIKALIKTKSGMKPNTMLVSEKVFYTLRNHPVIRDIVKYTKGAMPDATDLAAAFEVKNFIIATASIDAGSTTQPVWGEDNVIIAYVNERPAVKSVSFGYTFRLKGYRNVLTYEGVNPEGKFVEVRDKFDMILTAPLCGYLITSAI